MSDYLLFSKHVLKSFHLLFIEGIMSCSKCMYIMFRTVTAATPSSPTAYENTFYQHWINTEISICVKHFKIFSPKFHKFNKVKDLPNLVLNTNWITGNEGRVKRELNVCYKVINEVEPIVSERRRRPGLRIICVGIWWGSEESVIHSSLQIREATPAHNNISLNELTSLTVRMLLK